MRTIIIGLLGPAGAGKSTVASYLVEKYGATRYSLAEPLKQIAMRTLDLSQEQCFGTQAQKEAVDPRYGFSARWFLQRLGTEGIRHVFGEDVWANLLIDRIRHDRPAVAVVEDVRFVNEANLIRCVHNTECMDGYVWRLEAPYRETIADSSHASEAQWKLAEHDFVIAPTEYGIPHLHRLVDDAARHYKLFPVRPEQAL